MLLQLLSIELCNSSGLLGIDCLLDSCLWGTLPGLSRGVSSCMVQAAHAMIVEAHDSCSSNDAQEDALVASSCL